MRDFDLEREDRIRDREARWAEEGVDRSFKLGGEIFEYPNMVPASVVVKLATVTSDATGPQVVRMIAEALPQLIVPDDDAIARLEHVKHHVEFEDIQNACFWIVGELTGRPTQAPAPSGPGRETTGTSSTEPSSSDQVETVASAA